MEIRVGNIIKSKYNQHLYGKVVAVDDSYIKYKSPITGLVQSIHKSNIYKYDVIG